MERGQGCVGLFLARLQGPGEADAIATIEPPVRDDARERVNRYVAQSRAKHLLAVIEVEKL